jgi:uncharacterized protein (TIGR03437 family)
MRLAARFAAGVALSLLLAAALPNVRSKAQTNDPRFYDIGALTLTDIWVDPSAGNDNNSGATRDQSLRTLTAAWNRIPRGTTLTGAGYRIKLAAGVYPPSTIPSYFELRYGAPQSPVIIQSADGRGAAVVTAFMNIFDCRYLYLIDLKVAPDSAPNALHLDRCDHVLLRGMTMDGKGSAPQTLKVNNSDHVYVEDCDVFGASGSAADFVATRHGRIIANRIHDAGSWALLVKGGSAYFHIEANELYNASRGGFDAGQTTGFEFLDSPWLHYEAYDVKFINNVVHDTGGGGMAVNGGYNILLAYNTLYRVGRDGHLVEILFGQRVCSSDTAKCANYLNAGGWGTTSTASADLQPIPNQNVFVYNNVIYNPPEMQSRSSHFAIYSPRTPAPGTNIPSPAYLDANLQIRGNIVWNGARDKAIGTEWAGTGCQPSNPTCNEAQLRADNAINSIEPQQVNPANGDFRPAAGSNIFGAKTFAIPGFGWNDAPARPLAPAGNFDNTVNRDRNNVAREQGSPAGAYTVPMATAVSAANYKTALAPESVATAFGVNLATATAVANSLPLPTSLSGTSVTLRDSAGVARLAPLFSISPAQVNFLVPAGTATGTATVSVENSNGSFSMGRLQVANVAPGLFSADASGKGVAVGNALRVRADGSRSYEPIARFDSAQNKFVAAPIDLSNANDQVFLILYGTGVRHRGALNAVSVSVGGVDSEALFAGAQGALAGLDQVNVRLARGLAGRGDVDVVLTVEGQPANTVRVNIH